MIEKFIEKIDSYNIFTNVIPGLLFLMFNSWYFKLEKLEFYEQIVIAYFIGQTLNRIGSIVIEKILLRIKKIELQSYKEYVLACEKDKKIDMLLQERNVCRTLVAMFVMCIIEVPLVTIIKKINMPNIIYITIVLIFLTIIYSISFYKYNKYIIDRVNKKN